LALIFLLLFIGRLWATLRQAERGTGWLLHAALSGGLFYLLFELSRGVVVDAVIPRIGHGLDGPEAVTLWDLSNAFTVATWLAIALFLVPTAIVAIRKRALPLWLGILTALIAVANFVYGSLPPSGPASLGESAFLLWILVTSVVLFFSRPLSARA
jgi:hypothetical protein